MSDLYTPAYFPKVIDGLKERFLYKTEFPLKRKGDAKKTISFFESGAFAEETLTGYQLEEAILSLKSETVPESLTRALVKRAGGRILGLLWAVFQYDYKNPNILKVFEGIAKTRGMDKVPNKDGRLIYSRNFCGEPVKAAFQAMQAQGALRKLLPDFGIIPGSPFWRDIVSELILAADKETLRKNFSLLEQFAALAEDINPKVIIHYLDLFDQSGYSTEANKRLVERFGLPPSRKEEGVFKKKLEKDGEAKEIREYDKAFWAGYPAETSEKLILWNKLYMLTTYMDERKSRLFIDEFADDIKDIRYDGENHIVKIIFGDFNVIDDGVSEYSLYCRNPMLSLNVASFSEVDARKSARDFMVERGEDDYMQLFFTGVDKMYVKEMLNILLGKSNDYRNEWETRL
ncbi:MAG: hypothetical protein LBU36_08510 [Clostridiales bacterium]|jgi:hypothetical protein|nr:hypothetical protein [Clostridiales bacterium]